VNLDKEKKKIYFNLEEFKVFFSSLDLNCRFNEESGNIESVDGIFLKGEITESKIDKKYYFITFQEDNQNIIDNGVLDVHPLDYCCIENEETINLKILFYKEISEVLFKKHIKEFRM